MSELIDPIKNGLLDELLRQRIDPSFGSDFRGVNPPLDVDKLALAAVRSLRGLGLSIAASIDDESVIPAFGRHKTGTFLTDDESLSDDELVGIWELMISTILEA